MVSFRNADTPEISNIESAEGIRISKLHECYLCRANLGICPLGLGGNDDSPLNLRVMSLPCEPRGFLKRLTS
jgi:hypothetical protein